MSQEDFTTAFECNCCHNHTFTCNFCKGEMTSEDFKIQQRFKQQKKDNEELIEKITISYPQFYDDLISVYKHLKKYTDFKCMPVEHDLLLTIRQQYNSICYLLDKFPFPLIKNNEELMKEWLDKKIN